MERFMKDRYGVDDLSMFIGGLGIVLALIGTLLSLRAVSIVALLILVLDLARAFSKNIPARQRENEAYRRLMSRLPVVGSRFANGSSSSTGATGFRDQAGARRAAANADDVKRQMRTAKKMWKERKTKAFLKCPTCGTMLSVPKGKGKIIVTCPKCHTRMETKS